MLTALIALYIKAANPNTPTEKKRDIGLTINSNPSTIDKSPLDIEARIEDNVEENAPPLRNFLACLCILEAVSNLIFKDSKKFSAEERLPFRTARYKFLTSDIAENT